jgi:hypothetical protein
LAGLRVKVAFMAVSVRMRLLSLEIGCIRKLKGLFSPLKKRFTERLAEPVQELSALEGTGFKGCGKLVLC